MKRLADDGAAAPLDRLPPRAQLAAPRGPWRANEVEAWLGRVGEELRAFLQGEEDRLRDRKLRSLAEFAAGAAHEINTPLAIISGQAQQLRRSVKDAEHAGCLAKIIEQAQRIHQLLRDLMFYARPPVLQPRRVALNRLVHEVADKLSGWAAERQVRLKAVVPAARASLRADEALLRLALGCLVRNAIEAAPAGGWARITLASRPKQQVAIVVEDNGPGLAASQREHGFDPFYSGRSAGRGVGLGLSKVWRIAQLHGGDIRIASGPGQRTRFELVLPTSRLAQPSTPVRHSANGQVNGRPQRKRPRQASRR